MKSPTQYLLDICKTVVTYVMHTLLSEGYALITHMLYVTHICYTPFLYMNMFLGLYNKTYIKIQRVLTYISGFVKVYPVIPK